MMKNIYVAGLVGFVLLMGTIDCHAENWIKNDLESKSIASNYHDADSVKVKDKTLSWTEKTVLTDKGVTDYGKILAKYPACKQAIEKKGNVTQHQTDLEIRNGQYRSIAKRNYNKANELVCSDKDQGKDFDASWHRIGRRSPIETTYYNLVTLYKLGDF